MSNKLTAKKPLFAKQRSHAMNSTNVKKKVNLQTKRINGVKVTLAASEWKTLKKDSKTA